LIDEAKNIEQSKLVVCGSGNSIGCLFCPFGKYFLF